MLRSFFRKTMLFLGPVLAMLAAVLVGRTALYERVLAAPVPAPPVAIPELAAERLAGSLRIRTISHADPGRTDTAAFPTLHTYLAASFPRVHSTLARETVNTHSLLYTWRGSDPSLKPILLMGHLDVVPVEPGTETKWQRDPFGGVIADGYVWGRGAIDNKSAVVGTLEAIEMLLVEGFQPKRTVYIAYGHDEEVGGGQGARHMASLLKSRNIELDLVLDEGGVVGDGILPGVTAPVALIGIAEKGFVTVELSVRGTGGHSSLPPPQSPVGILSSAIAHLEASQVPARLDGATRQMFDRIGPQFPFAQRAVFANLWLTRPFVTRKLEGNSTTNAMVRTTTAATVFQAGTKDNVLPTYARAVVNFRILPGDTVNGVLEHVRRVIDDRRIEVNIGGAFQAEPSALSNSESNGFRQLELAIRSVTPEAIVAPYLVVVVSDSRYFADISENVFRFLPVRLTPRDLERMHGIDERISVRDYATAIRFYHELLRNAAVD